MNGIVEPQSHNIKYKLFSLRQVTIASWIGSPLTGFTLIAINYKKQGSKDKYHKNLTIGAFYIAFLTVLSLIIPDIPSTVYIFGSALWLRKYYKQEQYSLFKEHIRNGGEIEANSQVFTISVLAFCVAVIIVLLTIVVSASLMGF